MYEGLNAYFQRNFAVKEILIRHKIRAALIEENLNSSLRQRPSWVEILWGLEYPESDVDSAAGPRLGPEVEARSLRP